MRRAYVELLRPANVVTAIADVLAGFAIAGLRHPDALPWLIVSSCCLYAGGVVLNDVFDRDLDRVERPERPIPSGRVSTPRAAALGGGLLAAGVASGAGASLAAGGIALAIALVVLLYDAWGKRQAPIAPLNMALCRALNLMLGVAAVPAALPEAWPIAAVPLLYIYAVTVLSRGEVHGGSSRAASSALIILVTAIGALLLVVIRAGSGAAPNLAAAVVLAAALGLRVVPAFAAARRQPAPATIRAAVKRGILSLVLVDAAIAAGFAGPLYAAVILVTGLVAGWLARTFAVT